MKKITVTMDQDVAAALASLAKQNKRGVGNEAALIIESWIASNKKRKKTAAAA